MTVRLPDSAKRDQKPAVQNAAGGTLNAFFRRAIDWGRACTWTGALYNLALLCSALWVWMQASHAMDSYEHIALFLAVCVLSALGISWPRLRIAVLGVSVLTLGAVFVYQHDLSRAETVFILKYLLASQSALLWMGVLFLLTTLFYWLGMLFQALGPSRLARGFCWAAIWMGSTGLGVRWYESYLIGADVGHIPISNLYEVFILFCLVTALLYLYFESTALNQLAMHQAGEGSYKASCQASPQHAPASPHWRIAQAKIYALGAFVMLVITAALGFLVWYSIARDAQVITPLVPALQSGWMKIHVPANFVGYGSFALAAMLAFAYLLKHYGIASNRLPDFTVLDALMYQAIMVGFAFFTLATVLGALWAAEAWGGYWSWDPKETWALIVWLNYAAWLHMRLIKGLRGVVAAWWAFIGLFITAFAFLGVNMFLSGLHSYGTL